MSLLIQSLTYVHPDGETLFENLSLALGKGEKAALIGRNGTGKSTLLRLLAGALDTSGPAWYVPQLQGFFGQTIAQALAVAKKLHAFKAILNGDAAPEHFQALADDWAIEEKIVAALANWQLGHLDPGQSMDCLSGGERIKVLLAGITLHQPDIILLDESSNHLDREARVQLYELVEHVKATLLVVSHDRQLLNLLPETIELSKQGLERFGGNYDFYVSRKQQDILSLEARIHEQTKSLKQANAQALEMREQRGRQEARGKAQGKSGSLPRILAGRREAQAQQSSARVNGAQKEKISQAAVILSEQMAQLQTYKPLAFDLQASTLYAGKLLAAIKSPVPIEVRSGERIRIQGRNGSGKTTLLRALMTELDQTSFIYVYLDQEYRLIDESLPVFEQAQRFNERHLPEHEVRSLLVYAQFPNDSWDRPCSALSGGEKLKLSLCCLSLQQSSPDMLILDEPTNNLDMQSLDILVRTVRDFTGTLLVVSHDEWFIAQIVTGRDITLT